VEPVFRRVRLSSPRSVSSPCSSSVAANTDGRQMRILPRERVTRESCEERGGA
jgi:hypothetical protein